MAMKDRPFTIDELTGPLDPNQQKAPGYGAWLQTQLLEAVKDLDENPDNDVSHEEVFASLDEIIQKHKDK